jgi:hypothetical protein
MRTESQPREIGAGQEVEAVSVLKCERLTSQSVKGRRGETPFPMFSLAINSALLHHLLQVFSHLFFHTPISFRYPFQRLSAAANYRKFHWFCCDHSVSPFAAIGKLYALEDYRIITNPDIFSPESCNPWNYSVASHLAVKPRKSIFHIQLTAFDASASLHSRTTKLATVNSLKFSFSRPLLGPLCWVVGGDYQPP